MPAHLWTGKLHWPIIKPLCIHHFSLEAAIPNRIKLKCPDSWVLTIHCLHCFSNEVYLFSTHYLSFLLVYSLKFLLFTGLTDEESTVCANDKILKWWLYHWDARVLIAPSIKQAFVSLMYCINATHVVLSDFIKYARETCWLYNLFVFFFTLWSKKYMHAAFM